MLDSLWVILVLSWVVIAALAVTLAVKTALGRTSVEIRIEGARLAEDVVPQDPLDAGADAAPGRAFLDRIKDDPDSPRYTHQSIEDLKGVGGGTGRR